MHVCGGLNVIAVDRIRFSKALHYNVPQLQGSNGIALLTNWPIQLLFAMSFFLYG